jgi:hypothetical protein
MPKISLVVCLYRERDFLERLLRHAEGCYDDLVVVHDGVEGEGQGAEGGEQGVEKSGAGEPGWKSPEELSLQEPDAPPLELARDYAELSPEAPLPTGYRLASGTPRPGSIHELVASHGGRFYEGPRCFQQEPHWPFAWWAAKHDWILRLDADEFPSFPMKDWLALFRVSKIPDQESGYLGIWPLWNGKKELWITRQPSRLFLFDKKQMSFFGMVEHNPTSDKPLLKKALLIHHRPQRKSYGVANLLCRKQAYRWRKVIARSILESPRTLPHWNLQNYLWPKHWENIRRRPFYTALKSGLLAPIFQAIHESRQGSEFVPDAYLGTGIHQSLMALTYALIRQKLI